MVNESVRDTYARTTIPRGTRPLSVLRPGSTKDVQAVVRIAQLHHVPLYPISGGKNWGLGSACAVTDGQVIVDLGRMNRILEVNEDLAYAEIEPGVTQGQLHQYLCDRNLKLWFDATGAGPDATIVGNLMERGYGHTPLGDRFHNSCGFEVVLADGRVLNTGTAHYSSSQTRHIFKTGIGPSLDGLFTQSSLGIVTRVTTWLLPRPEYFQAFVFKIENSEDLPAVIDALRPLRMNGIIQSAVHIANDLRVISAHQQSPVKSGGADQRLPDALRKQLRSAKGLGDWNGLGGLYGTKKSVRAAAAEIRRALQGIAAPRFLDDRKLRVADRVAAACKRWNIANRFADQVDSIRSAYGLLKGVPTNDHLAGMAWRAKQAVGKVVDPLECGLGFMWLSAVVPMTGSATRALQSLVEPIFARYGFDPLITYVVISPRAMACPLTVCYEKCDQADAQRAEACHAELFDAVMREGLIPYRCGINSMSKLARGSTGFWDVVSQLKNALDPAGIFAPGRYFIPDELAEPTSNAARDTYDQSVRDTLSEFTPSKAPEAFVRQ
jgi:4-cresol dehydrogenase (hydroxylating)